jgi:predicted molibdopterin-dependent oxidoreductase YjgC
VQLELAAPTAGGPALLGWPQIVDFKLPRLGLMAFPFMRLYDCGATLQHSQLLHERIGEPYLLLNAPDAERLKVSEGSLVRITFSASDQSAIVQARISAELPERVVLVPRSFGLPVDEPAAVEIRPAS